MSPAKDKPKDQSAETFLLNDLSNRLAKMEKKILQEAREKKEYRVKRENKEEDTQAKIERIYNQSTSFWFYIRDRILPPVIVGIILYFLLQK